MKILLFSVLLLTSIFVACNSDDGPEFDTNTTFLDYLVQYNSDSNQTTITARFKEKNVLGNEIELSASESITFNGEILEYNPQTGYTKTYEGLIVDGDFEYISSEKKIYTSSLFNYESVDFPASFTSISKSNNMILKWNGEMLTESEFIELAMGDPDQGVYGGLVHDVVGTTSLEVKPFDMSGLTIGNWTAYLNRGKVIYDQNLTSAGGRIVAKYRSKTIQIEVSE